MRRFINKATNEVGKRLMKSTITSNTEQIINKYRHDNPNLWNRVKNLLADKSPPIEDVLQANHDLARSYIEHPSKLSDIEAILRTLDNKIETQISSSKGPYK
ncbi:MAG: hypothetical protein A3F18_06810 [Legionellales bacterium RIFCSPHIGHO2_12_FULL_37_14]|nr:MAG: hypothetical protein A3F18_06810 [Legionellales bacterium RIFCSPHIGHO2_12_FULL_37_14]